MFVAIMFEDEVDVMLVFEIFEDILFGEYWDLVGLIGMGFGLVWVYEIVD